MKIKLSEILKQQGLFSQDIKVRFKNRQIFVNGEVVPDDIDIDCVVVKGIADVVDAGDFLFFDLIPNPKWLSIIKAFGFENLFDTNIENDLTLFLKNFILIKTSKKQMFVVKV